MKLKLPKLNLQVDLSSKLNLLFLLTVVCSAGFKYFQLYKKAELYQTYTRQTKGLLTKSEHLMQQQSQKFDLANSTLVTQNYNLENDVKNQRDKYGKLSEEFDKYIEDHNLIIKQYQRRLYTLKQRVESTEKAPAKVVVKYDASKCDKDLTVSYSYQEPYGRVSFSTPNCLSSGGEVLELNQSFVIYGEVYQQEDVFLKVSSLTLNEVSPSDPTLVLAKANLIDSDFKYKVEPLQLITRSFTFNAGATSSKDMFAGLGYIFYTWSNYDFSMALNYGVKDSFHSTFNVAYSPIFQGKQTNFSFQLGAGYTLKTSLIYTFGVSFVLW